MQTSQMQLIDWLAVIIPISVVLGFAFYTRRFVKGVADFLAGGRCANRYLLANARGAADVGLVNSLGRFEVVLVSGFVLSYWDLISVPVLMLVSVSGFIVYRFRETRAMTLAQFFEMRYGPRYRLFMGILAFVAGILNYGIFPAVASRFLVYFLDLPQHVELVGLQVPTFALIMAIYLSFCLGLLLIGGQVTLMVSHCVEGIFSHFVYILIVIVVFTIVQWDQVTAVMAKALPGRSMMDPFDANKIPDFNFGFAVMQAILQVYTALALQNRQGFNAAARTPHEAKMGGVLGNWRSYARTLITLSLGVCALAFMQHADFATQAAPAHEALGAIKDPYLHKQMMVPVALRYLLPTGIKGLFVAIMLLGLLAADSTHMHSWGSIFVQDVVSPLRKTSMSPKQHMWALRLAMAFVAAFALFFSLLWTQTQYIQLWWNITAGMFTAGAGAAIVGGLYWSKGTNQAAWTSTLTGSALALLGIILGSAFWPGLKRGLESIFDTTLPDKFWLNYQQSIFLVAVVTALVYIVVSYLTSRQPYDLDRMLHRGKYSESGEAGPPKFAWRQMFTLKKICGFDKNFTSKDKLISGGVVVWALLLLVVNLIISTWNVLFQRWPVEWWSNYWMIVGIGVPFAISVGTLVWFTIGGVADTRSFFQALRSLTRDDTDDGRVAPGLAQAKAAVSPAVAEPKAAIAVSPNKPT
jgi:SSS family solute:Na+ symporter